MPGRLRSRSKRRSTPSTTTCPSARRGCSRPSSTICGRLVKHVRQRTSKITSGGISALRESPRPASTWPTRACWARLRSECSLRGKAIPRSRNWPFSTWRGRRSAMAASKAQKGTARPTARTTIAVQGARVHNLKNISIEIPRDRLIVVTGLSGSGKSSLAFDTIYAEGQRRYMESLSTYAKRFIAQVSKPDVDFVYGLSPVISIEQKTIANNPRSTVGTMTDISSYLNLLYATIGQPHCPRTGEPTPSRTSSQILEAILSLPEGAEIELRAPVFKQYGEELDFVLTEVRKKGCRWLIIDGKHVDISEKIELDEAAIRHIDAVVDRLAVSRRHEKSIKAGIAATLLV